MPLRPSQVETLRAVELATGPPAVLSVTAHVIGVHLGIGERRAYERLRRLETRRYLASRFANRRIAFYLTQLGREALEGQR
jgi:hypothetical protein